MLTASLSVTGTHRILMDLLEGLNKEKFQILVAYKPEFPGPGDALPAARIGILFKNSRSPPVLFFYLIIYSKISS